jgi:hypothetical protein
LNTEGLALRELADLGAGEAALAMELAVKVGSYFVGGTAGVSLPRDLAASV